MPNSPRTVVVVSLVALAGAGCGVARAQLFGPGSYYSTISYNAGLGFVPAATNLKSQLFGRVSSPHTPESYDDARVALAWLDLNVDATGTPVSPARLVLMYNGDLVDPAWISNQATSLWNREHIWPQSRGAAAAPLQGDLHHLRACDLDINTTRSENSFGLGGGSMWDPDAARLPSAITAGFVFRGETARSVFYVDTRYASDPAYTGLSVTNGDPANPTGDAPAQLGDKAALLEWHFAQPPSIRERRRNHLIQTGFTHTNTINGTATTRAILQSNRNPFVDHPEWVWAIYGTAANSSKLYFGASAPADGASVVNIEFGRFIAGTGIPTQNLTLNKAGTTPTYFNVTATTNASSSITGPLNAFTSAAGQTRTITVGLVTTSTPSLLTGTVTVDNTDLTSNGAGQGSADANDVVNLQATMLARANASFAAASDQNTLTINFGTVAKNSSTPFQAVTIYNLVNVPGFTAKLDLDSINGSGSTSILTTDFAPILNIDAGSSASFNATVYTGANEGPYAATYTLVNSDENVPGALAGTSLTLTLNVTIGPPVIVACNAADIVGPGGTPGPDGLNTVDDLVHFLSEFFAGNLAVADLVTPGGSPPADGTITVDDLVYFLALFFAPCN